ncbi:MAG: CBS domain-containing protein [Oxalobacteraceae bacterium]|nr:CBS domain-containing protein [Oxalobacteraceae bacterium]
MKTLKELMSPDVQVISADETIEQAAQQMREGNFGMLPVAENDRMIGAISDRDIAIRAIADGKDPSTKVRDVMSEGIVWAYKDDSVEHAAELMSEHQIRRLPIVNAEKRLVGILALGDFKAFLICVEPDKHGALETKRSVASVSAAACRNRLCRDWPLFLRKSVTSIAGCGNRNERQDRYLRH